MAKVKKNMMLSGLSGSLGPDHYARVTKDGRTIISLKPDFSNRQFSEAQLHVQSRTKQAAAYAKVASKENPIYAQKAAGTSKNAYHIAFRDWRKPPVIDRIQCQDGQVRVSAHDDVMVTRVTVTILDEAGQPLEQGEAELWMGVWWEQRAADESGLRRGIWQGMSRAGSLRIHENSISSLRKLSEPGPDASRNPAEPKTSTCDLVSQHAILHCQ